MGNIDVEFSEANSKAKKISDYGSDIKQKANTVIGYENSVASAWKGDSAELFLKKYHSYATNLKNDGEKLRANGLALKNSTERLQNAEQTILSWLGR